MNSAADIAAAILALPQRNRSGTLRMFGDWFGRPMDNVHNVVGAESGCEQLTLTFNNGETLNVWNPSSFHHDRLHYPQLVTRITCGGNGTTMAENKPPKTCCSTTI